LLRHQLVGADEIAAGHSLRAGHRLPRTLAVADVEKTMTRGDFARPTNTPARFKEGDRVRARNINPVTHTRLPRYARGKRGVVEAIRGCHVFPDTAALGAGENPQWLYTVVFSARELWGEDADSTVKVSIEAFEPYLDPA
jgi:nitrile hydratase